jgi:hypothetical protein
MKASATVRSEEKVGADCGRIYKEGGDFFTEG